MHLNMIGCQRELMEHKVVALSRGCECPTRNDSSACDCFWHDMSRQPDLFISLSQIWNTSSYPTGCYPICQIFASSDLLSEVCLHNSHLFPLDYLLLIGCCCRSIIACKYNNSKCKIKQRFADACILPAIPEVGQCDLCIIQVK